MPVLIVIPARYASTRYPAKPLVQLKGFQGASKTLIERSWEAASKIELADKVVVATDHDAIAQEVERFGGDVVMTSEACRNGTERCAEVASKFPDYDVVVNFQGDAPLTPPWFVEDLLEALFKDTDAAMATPVLKTSPETLSSFQEDRRHGRVGGTTAVLNAKGHALYFSKEVLPYTPQEWDGSGLPVYHHVGVYAFRRDSLLAYNALSETELERREGLEQLRFLVHGMTVKCVPVDARGHQFWELNNPEDVPRVEEMLVQNEMP